MTSSPARWWPTAAALLATVLPSGCAAPAASPAPEPPVATYGDLSVTEADVRALAPRTADDPRQAVEAAVLTRWLAEEAVEKGLDGDRAVALELARIASRPAMKALEEHVRAGSEPTEAAILDYLDEHRHQLEKPRRIRLATLFKRAPESAPAAEREAVRSALEAIRRRIADGEEFGELARQESEDVNRYRGGKMGAIAPGKLPGALDEIAFALEVDETSEVIAVRDGFVLLHNAGELPPETMTEEEAIERIRAAMRRWNHDAAWEALRDELLADGAELADVATITAAAKDTVVGKVAEFELTLGDLERMAQASGGAPPMADEGITPFRALAILEQFAFQQLAARRAAELELTLDPRLVAQAAAARTRRLAQATLDRRAAEQPVEVSDEAARAFYSANPRMFSIPDRQPVSVIQLRLDETDPETVRARTRTAWEWVEAIRSGTTTFEDAARQASEHPSAAEGGDLGLKPRRWAAALGPNVLDAFDRLEVGEVSDPIRQDHLWILRKGPVEPGRELSWEEAAASARWGVRQRILQQRRTELEARLLEELRGELVVHRLPEIEPRRRPQRPGRAGRREGAAGESG